MSKTETTKQLERLLANHFDPRRDFFVFECTLGWYGHEVVDCVMYNCEREVYCYEIKQSKQDFHSNNKLSFFGNKNYFVMPLSLYEEVKDEIPHDIGCFVAVERVNIEEWTVEEKKAAKKPLNYPYYKNVPIAGFRELYCVKKARRLELRADKEVILSSMLRSMQRDVDFSHWRIDKTEQDGNAGENNQ